MNKVNIEELPFDLEIISDLVRFYINKGILTKRNLRDARHIAIATYYGADALISWNFDDIVNLSKIPRILEANHKKGFEKSFLIISPLEVR